MQVGRNGGPVDMGNIFLLVTCCTASKCASWDFACLPEAEDFFRSRLLVAVCIQSEYTDPEAHSPHRVPLVYLTSRLAPLTQQQRHPT